MNGIKQSHGEDPWYETLDYGLDGLVADARHALRVSNANPVQAPMASSPSHRIEVATSATREAVASLPPSIFRALPPAVFQLIDPMRNALSKAMRCPVQLELQEMQLQSWSEIAAGRARSSVVAVLRVSGSDSPWLLEVPTQLMYPWIDRMLLQGRESEVPSDRPLTQLELKIAARAVGCMWGAWQESWGPMVAPDSFVERMEQPSEWTAASSASQFLSLRMEVGFGPHVGALRWLLPADALVRHESMLAALAKNVDRTSRAWIQTQSRLASLWPMEEHELTVSLASIAIPREDLAGLEAGDIISLDQSFTEWLSVAVDGQTRFLASPGSSRGRKAIRIESVLASIDERVSSPKR
jgi:flagellar motor switch protein FliM